MSREGDLMRKALKRALLPELKLLGFDGTSSSFQRKSDKALDLLSIQYWKYGGQFILEFARRERGDLHTSWGEVIPEERLDVAHTSPTQRARLQRKDDTSEEVFRGFKFEGFGEDQTKFDALANQVASLLPQVIAWLETGVAGENVHAVGRGA